MITCRCHVEVGTERIRNPRPSLVPRPRFPTAAGGFVTGKLVRGNFGPGPKLSLKILVRPDQTYQKLWSGLKNLVRMLEVALQPVYRGFT